MPAALTLSLGGAVKNASTNKHAIQLIPRPKFPKQKLSPQQSSGLTYERKVFKHFKAKKWPGELLYSPWFRQGSTIHNPDILLIQPSLLVVFECKLGQTDTAIPQLRRYAAICSEFFGLPCALVQVFRNLYRPCQLITSLPMKPNSLSHWHLYL